MKPINVVAAIIKKKGSYFIAQRNKEKYMGLKWEFPGGKVDPGETLSEALSREIHEELNINIRVHEKLAQEKYKDNEINIVLHYYLCTLIDTNIVLSEHEAIEWVKKQDFLKYEFVPGDGDITSLI